MISRVGTARHFVYMPCCLFFMDGQGQGVMYDMLPL